MRAEKPKRRKRSEMSRADCLLAFEQFAKRLHRFAETSGVPTFDELPRENIGVVFSVEGSFGVASDLFEAIRVLGGFKLPRDEKTRSASRR